MTARLSRRALRRGRRRSSRSRAVLSAFSPVSSSPKARRPPVASLPTRAPRRTSRRGSQSCAEATCGRRCPGRINPWDRPAGDRRSNDACENADATTLRFDPRERTSADRNRPARGARARVGGTPRVVSWIGWWGPRKVQKPSEGDLRARKDGRTGRVRGWARARRPARRRRACRRRSSTATPRRRRRSRARGESARALHRGRDHVIHRARSARRELESADRVGDWARAPVRAGRRPTWPSPRPAAATIARQGARASETTRRDRASRARGSVRAPEARRKVGWSVRSFRRDGPRGVAVSLFSSR